MSRTIRVKTLVVLGAFVLLVAAATAALYIDIPGVTGAVVALAYLLGRWSKSGADER